MAHATEAETPRDAFLAAAFWFGSRERADAILAAHPALASADIHVAATLGDDAEVRRCLAADPSLATATGGPRGVDPLTRLCFSVYLARDRERGDAFVRAAEALLAAGASASTGFREDAHQPYPGWESALYGAAGVAFHAGLTRLLLEHGADPNDDEVPYHAPETWDNGAFTVLLRSGTLTADSLATMILRKTDWHDLEGVRLALDHGADPNHLSRFGRTALHNALLSDNALAIIDLLLDRGADPALVATNLRHGVGFRTGRSSIALAARRGRGDVLASLERRGIPLALEGADRLAAACARGDAPAAHELARREPALLRDLLADGAELLAEFAGTNSAAGVAVLLDLGVPVDARYGGDSYMGVASGSTALHVAAWRAWPAVVDVLLARGADANAADDRGRTPLQLAVKACIDSYWTGRRSPRPVQSLLAAGARVEGIALPTGYDAIDTLLSAPRA